MATITPVLAKQPPAMALGFDVAKFLKAGSYSVRSSSVNYNDTSPAQLFEVLPNTLVLDIIVQVVNAFNGTTPSVTLGDGTDTDGFLTSAELVPGTVGYKSIKKGAQPFAGGKLYTAGDTIDAVITVTDTSAGQFRAWLVYRALEDEGL